LRCGAERERDAAVALAPALPKTKNPPPPKNPSKPTRPPHENSYIHPFIFSLATIIPMPPDDVLRRGSGTLCELLLMVEAFRAGVVCPNKHAPASEALYNGHLLDSETYIGGKVEALESGVFRADLPVRFRLKPEAYQGLVDSLDRDLDYALKVEAGWPGGIADAANYKEARAEVVAKLEALRDAPVRDEVPLIYHLDVAAMYPNIILTNRLQPPAVVTEEDCAACDFNAPGKRCLRKMEWVWRGEHFACTRSEYNSVKRQLMSETHAPAPGGGGGGGGGSGGGAARAWSELSPDERAKALKDRLKRYCHKVYKRVLDKPVEERRVAGICQRENPFYVDTVRAFRDRRYEYKGLSKTWKGKLDAAKSAGDALATAEARDLVVVYDSLQLAHKCILNSFYG
jgi:DNA polymerase epsilon subunit 1